MAGPVFINGRAAIYKGCAGQSVAFPDVCFCPPGPPAGPIPVPLPNTVVSADLENCAATVTIDGQPVAHSKSFFAKSTGNEMSRSTGGGVITHATQGRADFETGSPDVQIEGNAAEGHGHLLSHNRMAKAPSNTAPAMWMSTMDMSSVTMAPGGVKKTLHEGKDFVTVQAPGG
jgi:Domain of unknown function (DUF4150)